MCVLITKASSLSRFLVILVRTEWGKTPWRKDALVLRLGVCGQRSLVMRRCITRSKNIKYLLILIVALNLCFNSVDTGCLKKSIWSKQKSIIDYGTIMPNVFD